MLALCGACLLGTLVALWHGAGMMALVPFGLAGIVGWFCRQVFHLDDDGVRYRGMLPSEDFAMGWPEVTQVVLDTVDTSTPGEARGPVTRVRFLQRAGSGRVAMLWTTRNASRVLDACRARGLDVLDET